MESLADWVRRPEWEYLTALFSELSQNATHRILSVDPNDPAKIGRIQAEIEIYRWFTSGEVREKMTEEVKEAESGRRT